MSQQVRRLVALALATSAGLFASALVFLSGRPDALEPPENGHTLIGVQMDWSVENPRAYVERTGIYPAQYGDFMDYPLTEKTKAILIAEAKEAGQQRGNFFITLMPQGGSRRSPRIMPGPWPSHSQPLTTAACTSTFASAMR